MFYIWNIHTLSIQFDGPLSNVYICGDGYSKGPEGLMAPRVMVCAGHEANAILRLLTEQPVLAE